MLVLLLPPPPLPHRPTTYSALYTCDVKINLINHYCGRICAISNEIKLRNSYAPERGAFFHRRCRRRRHRRFDKSFSFDVCVRACARARVSSAKRRDSTSAEVEFIFGVFDFSLFFRLVFCESIFSLFKKKCCMIAIYGLLRYFFCAAGARHQIIIYL